MARAMEQEVTEKTSQESDPRRRSWLISLSSFFFILLQSACTAVMAISGLRLIIGIGSFAAATSSLKFLAAIHGDAIRIPMLALAVAGSVINLYVIWRVRSLRSRASSSWRVSPISRKTKRAEAIQITFAVLTLLLVAVEASLHFHLHGHI
jgi:hypothetical protein